MRSFSIIVGVVVLGVACGAQVVSPSPVCMGFNDVGFPASPPGVAVSVAGVLWHFTSASSLMIDRIDLWNPVFQPFTNFAIDVIPTTALGGPLAGPPIGTYAYQSPYFAVFVGWASAPASTAAVLAAGSTYALNLRASPSPSSCFTASYDPAGPLQLPYQLSAGCATTIPPSGVMGLIARLRGPSCGPGPPASVVSIGYSSQPTCQTPVFYCHPNLSSYTAPVLGLTNWPLTLSTNSVQGLSAYVFWSMGVNPTGSPIGSSGCPYYLDPVSLTANMQAGLEPLFTVNVAPPTTTFTIAIPASPAFAGVVVGFEALLVSPTPPLWVSCPLSGGLFGVATNALQVTLGY